MDRGDSDRQVAGVGVGGDPGARRLPVLGDGRAGPGQVCLHVVVEQLSLGEHRLHRPQGGCLRVQPHRLRDDGV